MLRLIVVVFLEFFSIFYYVPKMVYYTRHPEKYSEEDCFRLAQKLIIRVKRTARITTEYYGTDNLPVSGGYIMYSNHQGKYDAIGIIGGHKRPCTVLMDAKRAKIFIIKQFFELLRGQKMDKGSLKQQMRALDRVSKEVSEGRVYLIFPEGTYSSDQKNSTGEFKCGCFISAKKARCPIVPVTIIDSYRPFGENSLAHVTTKVIFHEPIPYDQYKELHGSEVARKVKDVIDAQIFKQK